jgi:hypothetical protein
MKMEQILERLLAVEVAVKASQEEIQTHQEKTEAMITIHEELMAIRKAAHEVIEAERKACLEVMACLRKMEAMIRASQEQMGAKFKICIEEMMASELEASRKKIRGHSRAQRIDTTLRSNTGMGFRCSTWDS